MIARFKVHSKEEFPERYGSERDQPANETGAWKDIEILSSGRCTGWSVPSLGEK